MTVKMNTALFLHKEGKGQCSLPSRWCDKEADVICEGIFLSSVPQQPLTDIIVL